MRPNKISTLAAWHEHFNTEDFAGKLSTPHFRVTRSRYTDGYFEYFTHKARPTSLVGAKRCFEDEDHLRSTMLHEMLHQYQVEVLGSSDAPHDSWFRSCARALERKYRIYIR